MPSTISAYGNILCRSENDRYHAEIGAARAALADRLGEPGTANVSGLMTIEPTGTCEWEPGHAASTDEIEWLTNSSRLLGSFDAHHRGVCRGCLPEAVADVLNGGTAGTPHVHVGVLQQLMTVSVPDWSTVRGYRQLTVSVRCPACGELRGRPSTERRYSPEHGVHQVQVWTNRCGHTDELPALRAEHHAILRSQEQPGVAA